MADDMIKGNPDAMILAIETSCDETSVAVVKASGEVLSNVVSSQMDIHERFGGVVPEVASRKHVETMTRIIEEALARAGAKLAGGDGQVDAGAGADGAGGVAGVGGVDGAGVAGRVAGSEQADPVAHTEARIGVVGDELSLGDMSAIAVTQGPGLVGALLVGVVAAKSLAVAADLPLIGVHHIAGHIYANALVQGQSLEYPCLALVVSGGHTELVLLEEPGSFRVVGRTRDDAVGEAYDKVARSMGLPYPGGPYVDKLALEADGEIVLPRAWLEADSYDFSFSGLKSAVLNVLNQARMRGEAVELAHLARGFQESVTDVLVTKALRAAEAYGARQLVLAGGVAANRGLRTALGEACAAAGLPLLVPPLELCTDNAAMIAAAALLKWERGQFTALDMKADPQLSLEGWSV